MNFILVRNEIVVFAMWISMWGFVDTTLDQVIDPDDNKTRMLFYASVFILSLFLHSMYWKNVY